MKVGPTLLSAVALMLALVLQEAAAQESGLLRGRTKPLSETALVKKALAGFIYGVQHNMPGIAREYYAPDKLLGSLSDAERSDEICSAAIMIMRRLGDNPIVMIVKPRITFQDGRAIVDCYLIWQFQNGNDEAIKLTGKERFAMVRNGSGYSIVESKLTSTVLTHWNSKKALEGALHRGRVRDEIRD